MAPHLFYPNRNSALAMYLSGAAIVVLLIIGAFCIWSFTDTSGTNSLAPDPQALDGSP